MATWSSLSRIVGAPPLTEVLPGAIALRPPGMGSNPHHIVVVEETEPRGHDTRRIPQGRASSTRHYPADQALKDASYRKRCLISRLAPGDHDPSRSSAATRQHVLVKSADRPEPP